MESAIIGALLPVLRRIADDLAGTAVADEALADVRALEAVVSKHVANAEAEVLSWLESRLHPAQPAG